MNLEQLKVIKDGKGFISALDQSGGSTPKALLSYGIEESEYNGEIEMMNLVHKMRSRIIKSPSYTNKHIVGAILFKHTMNNKIDGKYTADYLWDVKKVVPFLKIDLGLAEMKHGVKLMKPIPDLDEILDHAVDKNIFGTKMRSVIYEANEKGINKLVAQQFDFAKKIISHGLVPIIEPEVDINSPEKFECEAYLRNALKKEIKKLPKDDLIMLKLTLPTVDNFYSQLAEKENVIKIVALSGGYERDKACAILKRNNNIIASFSRAFAEGLNDKQTDEEFNSLMTKNILEIYDASVNKD